MNHDDSVNRYASMLVGPDDRSALILCKTHAHQAFLAAGTGLLHPVIDDIAVLLSREDRSYELELPVISAFLEEGNSPEVMAAAQKTLELLESRKGLRSFAWEDEEYWSRVYAKSATQTPDDSGWNDRIWQRQEVVKAANVAGALTVVDIGCGEGQNFRCGLRNRLAPESVYVALDISLSGLILNRQRNAWPNSLYILCSADKLPLASRSVDLVCYFGVLHHTKNKEKNLPAHLDILRPGGQILLCEAVERARILGARFTAEQSAHEERFDVKNLAAEIASQPDKVEVLFWRMRLSVFLTMMGRLFGPRPFLWRPSYEVLNLIDRIFITVLGPFLPWFRGGEVLAALKRPCAS